MASPLNVTFAKPADADAARRQARLISRGARNNPDVFGGAGTENAQLLKNGVNPTVQNVRNAYTVAGQDVPADVEADLVALQTASQTRQEVQRVPANIRRAGRLAGNSNFDLFDLEAREGEITRRLSERTRNVMTEEQQLARIRSRAATDQSISVAARSRLSLALDEATFDAKVSTQLDQARGAAAQANTLESVERVQLAGEDDQIRQEEIRTKRGTVGLETDRLKQQGVIDANVNRRNAGRNAQAAAEAAAKQAAVTLEGTEILNEGRASNAAVAAIKAETAAREDLLAQDLEIAREEISDYSRRELEINMTSGAFSTPQMAAAAERLGHIGEVDKGIKTRSDALVARNKAEVSQTDREVTELQTAIGNYGSYDAIPDDEKAELNVSPVMQQAVQDNIAEDELTRQQREVQALELVTQAVTARAEQRTTMMDNAARVLIGTSITNEADLAALETSIPEEGYPVEIKQPDGSVVSVPVPKTSIMSAGRASVDGFQLQVSQQEQRAAQITVSDTQLSLVQERFENFTQNSNLPMGEAAIAAFASAQEKATRGAVGPADLELITDALVEQVVGKTVADDIRFNQGKTPDKQRPVALSTTQSYQLQLVHNRFKSDDAALVVGFSEFAQGSEAVEGVADPIANAALEAVVGEDDLIAFSSSARNIAEGRGDYSVGERGEALYDTIFGVDSETGQADQSMARKAFARARAQVEPLIRSQQVTAMSMKLRSSLNLLPLEQDLQQEIEQYVLKPLSEMEDLTKMPILLQSLAVIEDKARDRNPEMDPDMVGDWLADSVVGSEQVVARGMQMFNTPRSHAGMILTAQAFGVDATSVPIDAIPSAIAKAAGVHMNSMVHSYASGQGGYQGEVDSIRYQGAEDAARAAGAFTSEGGNVGSVAGSVVEPFIEAGYVNTLERQLKLLEDN